MAAQTESPGKDSPEGKSRSMALLLTILVWVVAFLVAILLPPVQPEKPREPVYQSISLTLSSLPGIIQPAVAGQVAPADSTLGTEAAGLVSGGASVSGEGAVRETVSPAVGSAVPSRATAPAASSPVPVQPPLASSSTPSGPPPDQEPVNPNSFDQAAWESLFSGSSSRYATSPTPESPPAAPLDSASSLSGVAAASNPAGTGAASGTSLSKEEEQPVAAGTRESLSRIASAGGSARDASATEGLDEGTGSGSSATEGLLEAGTSLELVGGGRRRLLEPAEPVILISRENQGFIPGSLEVTVTFEITPEGVVRPGSIRITPESLVHQQVQEEIKTQIGKWRFQVAEGYGQVRFKYNIMKK